MTLAGCSSAADDDTATAASPYLNPQGQLTIAFSPMYSAYDGQHVFKIPAIVTQPIDAPKWSVEPADGADITQDANGGVMLTMRKAGSFKVYARSGNVMGVSDLHVTQATPEQWAMGEARYRNDVKINLMPPPAPADGGMPMGPPMFDLPDNAACGNCHGDGAERLKIQHTPQQIGGFSDEQLVQIFTMGMKPAGSIFKSMIPPFFYRAFHTWSTANAEETQALVVYLRSLEPKSQDGIDYGLRPSMQ
jgi:hypothetical protein